MMDIQDLFNVLSDDVNKVKVSGDRVELCADDNDYASIFKCRFKDIKDGTYYRKGHEPKKILLTDKDLDERTDLRLIRTRDAARMAIAMYNKKEIVFSNNYNMNYEYLADNFTWLDGSPCYKTEETE
ncbi:MAG: hypothetical protein ACTSYA_04230 [Candidatus Kariarchaeaceae archaeon]